MPSHYTPFVQTYDIAADTGVDIIGDIHGCMDELLALLAQAGYSVAQSDDRKTFDISHPEGRMLFLVGDLTDRGPRSVDVLRFTRSLIASGMGNAVMGNHDDKALRSLIGRPVKIAGGLRSTLDDIEANAQDEKEDFIELYRSMPTQILLRKEGERETIIVHGAAPEHHQLLEIENSYHRAIYAYGDRTDRFGRPKRRNWARKYRGERQVVHGHEPCGYRYIKNRVYNIDTGAVFGGSLTMFRLYERSFLEVPAFKTYYERKGFSKTYRSLARMLGKITTG